MGMLDRKKYTFFFELLTQFLLYALPVGLVTAITIFFFYHLDVQMSETDIHHTEKHHLRMRQELLTEGLRKVASDLRVLNEMVTAHVEEDSAFQGFDLEESVEHFEIYCREYALYRDFRIFREDGMEVANVVCHDRKPAVMAPRSTRENLRLRPWSGILDVELGDVWISDLTIGTAMGGSGEWFQPLVEFGTLLAEEPDGTRYFVVTGVSMRTLISDLLIDTGEGGTMLLVDRRGNMVGRAKDDVALAHHQWWGVRFQQRFPEVWERLWLSSDGEIESSNGLFSFLTLRPAQLLRQYQAKVEGFYFRPDAKKGVTHDEPVWKVVSHVPYEDLIMGRQRFTQKFTLLAPILLIAPLFGSWFLAKHSVSRREAARKLAENERYLRQIVDNVLDGIVTTSVDGTVEQSNAAIDRLFKLEDSGWRPGNIQQLLPKSTSIKLPTDEKEAPLPDQGLRTPTRVELELTRSDGTSFPAELVVLPSQLNGQQRLIWMVRDITERRELERKHESERMRFFHRTKMAEIGMLAAGIIHEVGNPIAAIQGLVDDLQMRAANPENRWDEQSISNLKTLQEQAQRLGGITRDISDYVRYRPGVEGLFDINGVIRSTARLVRYDARWKSIDLELDLDASVPALRGIEDQITQVIMNLLVNAADAVQENSPELRKVAVRSRYVDDRVEISVADNGEGMTDETLSRAFESFYTTKPEGKGTGLGLSLCRSIIEEHGGTIEIVSQPGQGAEFRIVLPVPAIGKAQSA
ncbi:MAG: hypothetical protein Kow006_09650 [Gammaproteobacteria bacterium]